MDMHGDLVKVGKVFLQGLGAMEIVTEYVLRNLDNGYPFSVTVDLTALLPSGETIAIECGNMHRVNHRLPLIVKSFDQIYWLPALPFLFKLEHKDLLGELKDISEVIEPKCTCLRCGHRWLARVSDPKRCPRCMSRYWDKPRKKAQVLVAGP